MSSSAAPLIDRFERVHRSLRISVTDRCNIRCQYCMSDGPILFLQKNRLLSFEQIESCVRVAVKLGINRVRLTGGEPLVRSELYKLVAALRTIDGLHQIAMTTNGMLLSEQIDDLLTSGLDRINISLDTLRETTFRQLARRNGLERVLAGIDAAVASGIEVRLNALVMRDINFEEVSDLVSFAVNRGLTIRFIEFMPLDQDRAWQSDCVVTGKELRELLQRKFGPLVPLSRERSAQPASEYRFASGLGTVGFIDPISEPFCGACDRLRLTADGKIRNCLFGREEWDVKQILDLATPDWPDQIERQFRAAVESKFAAHGIASKGFQPPQRAMYQIGG